MFLFVLYFCAIFVNVANKTYAVNCAARMLFLKMVECIYCCSIFTMKKERKNENNFTNIMYMAMILTGKNKAIKGRKYSNKKFLRLL